MEQTVANDVAFVYVNGERIPLLEDLRLALYHRFPVGTVLYDPSDLPPREVPLCTDPEEHGVTIRKLIPHGHYQAFFPDPENEGDLHPLTGPSICTYVTGLPLDTTAEMLGRYFEAFDMVAEADIFTGPSGLCNGRGWVVLQDPAKLLSVPPVLEFFPRYFIYSSLSDKLPQQATLPLGANEGHSMDAANPPRVDAMGGAPSNGNSHSRRHNGADGSRNGAKPPNAITPHAVNSHHHFFFAAIEKGDIERSVEEGMFWPSPTNRRSFCSTLERGPVNIIFVIQDLPVIFGYARLLPSKDTENEAFGCPIQWLKHHVFLQENDLKGIQSIPIARMSDGIPLKPEIGESICQIADRYPSLSIVPEDLGIQEMNGSLGRNDSRVGSFNDLGARQLTGDRGSSKSGFFAMPPQPVGVRQTPKGAHVMNNNIPPRRRPLQNDSQSSYASHGGRVVPPRKA